MAVFKYKNPSYTEGKPKYIPIDIPYRKSAVHIGNFTPTDDYKMWINPDNNEIRYKSGKDWNLVLGNDVATRLYAYGVEWDTTI